MQLKLRLGGIIVGNKSTLEGETNQYKIDINRNLLPLTQIEFHRKNSIT